MTGLSRIVEENDNIAKLKIFRFEAALTNCRTDYEKAVPMKRVHTHYSVIVADRTRGTEPRTWSKEDL